MSRVFKRAVKLVMIISPLSIMAQVNKPPVVEAGNDTTIRLIWPELNQYRFTPTISDDGLIYPEPKVLWRQIAGPEGGMEILAPDAERSKVDPYKTGVYTFEIAVDDSQYIVRDTLKVTVLDSIPFQVLAPKANEKVVIGSTYTVRWRIDPPGTSVDGVYSTDGGLSYNVLIENRTQDSSFQWQVPDTLSPSDNCYIKLFDYFRKSFRSVISERFSLVHSAGSVRKPLCGWRQTKVGNTAGEWYLTNGKRVQGEVRKVASQGIVILRYRTQGAWILRPSLVEEAVR